MLSTVISLQITYWHVISEDLQDVSQDAGGESQQEETAQIPLYV